MNYWFCNAFILQSMNDMWFWYPLSFGHDISTTSLGMSHLRISELYKLHHYIYCQTWLSCNTMQPIHELSYSKLAYCSIMASSTLCFPLIYTKSLYGEELMLLWQSCMLDYIGSNGYVMQYCQFLYNNCPLVLFWAFIQQRCWPTAQ